MSKRECSTAVPCCVLLSLLLVICEPSGAANVAEAETEAKLAAKPADLLQFTAAEHILGFQPHGMYLAALDHVLSVEFLQARSVTPQSDSYLAESRTSSVPPLLSRVSYPDLWPGITLVYEASEGGIAKSTFLLQPHADPAQIQLRYDARVILANDGSLQIQPNRGNDRGALTESTPVAWQDMAGMRVVVPVQFIVSQDGVIGFHLEDYDASFPVTIDPLYQWHTYYGYGAVGKGIAVDNSGNIYVAGYSGPSWLGDGNTNPLHAHSGGYGDIVILKLSSDGAYQWHTFYGTNSSELEGDVGTSIALDNSGNVYVAGYTPASWQGDGNANPLHAYSGANNDIVILKLSGDGAYQWHTFYGSSGPDNAYGITVDSAGDIYVTGSSGDWQGDGDVPALHPFGGGAEIFTLKLSSSGAYRWHTFYGSSGPDNAYGITVDSAGNVYVTGESYYGWQGDGNTNPLHASGYDSITVLKLTSSGAYQWHTFYGSDASYDRGYAVAVDGSGNVYVAGTSYSTWQGDGNTNPLHAFVGEYDIVVLKLSSSGAYQWHTVYGSSAWDTAWGMAVDGAGNVYVTGQSYSGWQGDSNANPLHAYSGANNDIVILKLSGDGAYQWHTFYGSVDYDCGYAVAIDGSRNLYITGYSGAWLGDNGASPLHPFGGDTWSIVVLKHKGVQSSSVFLPLVSK